MLGAPAMLLRPMFAAYQRGMTLQRLAHSERPSAGARDARPGRPAGAPAGRARTAAIAYESGRETAGGVASRRCRK